MYAAWAQGLAQHRTCAGLAGVGNSLAGEKDPGVWNVGAIEEVTALLPAGG